MSNDRRAPCPNQGKEATNKDLFADEDNPCLICSGTVKSSASEYFICPFILSDEDKTHAVFKKHVNMNLVTANERFFDMQQRRKIS